MSPSRFHTSDRHVCDLPSDQILLSSDTIRTLLKAGARRPPRMASSWALLQTRLMSCVHTGQSQCPLQAAPGSVNLLQLGHLHRENSRIPGYYQRPAFGRSDNRLWASVEVIARSRRLQIYLEGHHDHPQTNLVLQCANCRWNRNTRIDDSYWLSQTRNCIQVRPGILSKMFEN